MRRQSKICRNKGCTKHSRLGGLCHTHASQISGKQGCAKSKSKKQHPAWGVRSNRTRYKGVLNTIHPTVDHDHLTRLVREACDDAHSRECRVFFPIPHNAVLEKILLHLSTQLIDSIKQLQCSHPRIYKPKIIRASNKSDPWVKGCVHRDQEHVELSGHYTCMYFLDDVTVDNGAIKFWPDTAHLPFEPKKGVPKNVPSQIITGRVGTLLIFDGRIIHQAQPNTTTNNRDILNWILCSTSNAKQFNFESA